MYGNSFIDHWACCYWWRTYCRWCCRGDNRWWSETTWRDHHQEGGWQSANSASLQHPWYQSNHPRWYCPGHPASLCSNHLQGNVFLNSEDHWSIELFRMTSCLPLCSLCLRSTAKCLPCYKRSRHQECKCSRMFHVIGAWYFSVFCKSWSNQFNFWHNIS